MKIFTGKVISNSMSKTATVELESVIMHKLYGKRYKRSKKYHVHDEFGSKIGDVVNFVASKPYSKLKKWRIIGHVKAKKSDESEKTRDVKRLIKEKKI